MSSPSDELEFAKLDVMERLEKLRAAMLTQDPLLPTHLAAIHKNLIQYEELIPLLPQDEVIPTLMAAQKKHIGVMLTKEIATKKTVKVPKTTVDDL